MLEAIKFIDDTYRGSDELLQVRLLLIAKADALRETLKLLPDVSLSLWFFRDIEGGAAFCFAKTAEDARQQIVDAYPAIGDALPKPEQYGIGTPVFWNPYVKD